jgi:hypothetical protein
MMSPTPTEISLAVLEMARGGRFGEIRDLLAPGLRPMVAPEALQVAWGARRYPARATGSSRTDRPWEPPAYADPASFDEHDVISASRWAWRSSGLLLHRAQPVLMAGACHLTPAPSPRTAPGGSYATPA